MGAVNSCWVPRREFHENHVSTPKQKGHRRNLSAAFNLSLLSGDIETSNNLLNINTATEEELMTLPGINRLTAQNIVEYRRRIMGFRKVEDLALVSGVGATKLSQIRDEITVSHKKAASRGSSIESSNQELNPIDKDMRKANNNQIRLVNINTANVFQLMKVKGIGQAVAENIVSYRDKKGPFKSIDDLLKVKRIGPAFLGSIRYQLTLTDSGDDSSTASRITGTSGISPLPNGDVSNRNFLEAFSVNESGDSNANCIQPKGELSKDNLNLTASQDDLFDILGPLVVRPSRPNHVPYSFNNGEFKSLRVASWNLQHCNVDKASNPGVRDVVCMTVLENGFGVLAVQGLADQEALQRICDELNFPVLPNVKRWQGQRGSWDCVMSPGSSAENKTAELCGFLYDKSQAVSLIDSHLLEETENGHPGLNYRPFKGVFKIEEVEFVLICVHSQPHDTHLNCDNQQREPGNQIIQAVNRLHPDADNILILGNLSQSTEDALKSAGAGYKQSVCGEICPSSPSGGPSTGNITASGGIWVKGTTAICLTGKKGVVREGLHSPWIPDGWKWGGVVSEFCPIWTEVYTGKILLDTDTKAKNGAVLFFAGEKPLIL